MPNKFQENLFNFYHAILEVALIVPQSPPQKRAILCTIYKQVPVYTRRLYMYKLDGVGPVDKRPSTDKLHHFVREKK